MKKNRTKQAYLTFLTVRENKQDGFPENYALRWVCRYHLYVEKDDYSLREKFQKPQSRKAMIQLCNQCLQEMKWVESNGLFDCRLHYDYCLILLKQLRSFTQHYPLLWFLVFRLHLQ